MRGRRPLRVVLDSQLRTPAGAQVLSFSSSTLILTRDAAIVVLAFVVLYKFCDAFAGVMTAPFVIDLGFTRNDYAAIVKGVGLAATLIGGFAGGAIARAYPLTTALWFGAFLQMASNLVFIWQAMAGADLSVLTVTFDSTALTTFRQKYGEFKFHEALDSVRQTIEVIVRLVLE